MKKETGITAAILCVLIVLAGIFYLRTGAGEKSRDMAWQSASSASPEKISETPLRTEESPAGGGRGEAVQNSDCAVFICGAVRHPGVYYFSPESRVCDAVLAAGGFTKKADIQAVNQARMLTDGEQITIPGRKSARQKKKGSSEDSPAGSQNTEGKININTAEQFELMKIPGIGEAKAQMILEYREENGSFQSTEDIMKISGIKEGIYNQIRDYITV